MDQRWANSGPWATCGPMNILIRPVQLSRSNFDRVRRGYGLKSLLASWEANIRLQMYLFFVCHSKILQLFVLAATSQACVGLCRSRDG